MCQTTYPHNIETIILKKYFKLGKYLILIWDIKILANCLHCKIYFIFEPTLFYLLSFYFYLLLYTSSCSYLTRIL